MSKCISVFLIDLDEPNPDASSAVKWASLLPSSERERARNFISSVDRARYVASRVALRHLLGAAGATVHQACSFSCSAAGKPYLPGGPEFSMSRSGNIALVAISPQLSVGVDIERIRPVEVPAAWRQRFPALDRVAAIGPRIAPDPSVEFLRAWTRLEALAKRHDAPMGALLDQMLPPSFTATRVHDLETIPGYTTALACAEDGIPAVVKTRWSAPATPDNTASLPAACYPESCGR